MKKPYTKKRYPGNPEDLNQPFEVHEWPCKLCGCVVRARVAAACPVAKLESWRKMATCDHCFDGWDIRNDAIQAISKICGFLAMNDQLVAKDSFAEIAAKLRKNLEEWAEVYAQGHAMLKRLRQYPTDPEVSRNLFEHPGRAQAILNAYRAYIDGWKQPQPRDTHPDA